MIGDMSLVSHFIHLRSHLKESLTSDTREEHLIEIRAEKQRVLTYIFYEI